MAGGWRGGTASAGHTASRPWAARWRSPTAAITACCCGISRHDRRDPDRARPGAGRRFSPGRVAHRHRTRPDGRRAQPRRYGRNPAVGRCGSVRTPAARRAARPGPGRNDRPRAARRTTPRRLCDRRLRPWSGAGGHARCRDLPRLPGRNPRPLRPPLPLPVHQLHRMRTAFLHRRRHPLRPRAHHHARLCHVRRLRRRIRRPRRPPLPRPADRLPRLRPARLDRTARWRGGQLRGLLHARRRGRGRRHADDGPHRRGEGDRRLPSRLRRRQRRRRAAPARRQAPAIARLGADGA